MPTRQGTEGSLIAAYKVAVVNENNDPLKNIDVAAISLNDWPDVSATATTGDAGVCTFTGLSGPHWFAPRVRRSEATIGERSHTGQVKTMVISLGEGMNVDYVVDPDGLGTHTTLTSAVAAAIATNADKSIWMCKSVTESDIEVGGLDTNAMLTISSHSPHTVIISSGANKDIFKQTSTGGNTSGGLRFHNVGFYVQTATYAIYQDGDVGGGMGEIRHLIFDSCVFNEATGGGFLARNTGSLAAMGDLQIEVRDCRGITAGFYDNKGSTAPDRLFAWSNADLTLTNWWTDSDGGAQNAPDFCYIEGGHYTVANAITIKLQGTHDGWTFKNLVLSTGCSGAHFKTDAADTNVKHVTFENITFYATARDTDFGDFQSPAAGGSPQHNLFIHGIHGVTDGDYTQTGTFLTVDSDITSPYVSDIHAPDWNTVYSGPTPSTSIPVSYGADVTIENANKLYFRDTGLYIYSSTDGQLDIVADTTLTLTAPQVEITNTALAAGEAALEIYWSGDSDPRFSIAWGGAQAIGVMLGWGGGGAAVDVLLRRASNATLEVTGSLQISEDFQAYKNFSAGREGFNQGTIVIFGAPTISSEGGELRLHLADDEDATTAYWTLDVFADDLRFFPDDNPWGAPAMLTYEGQLQLPATAGASTGLLLGGDVLLYRNAANVLRTPDKLLLDGEIEIDGALNHDGSNAGFYGTAPTTKPANTTDIVDGMLSLGLTTAGSAVGYYGGIHGYDENDTIAIAAAGIANKVQVTTFDANDAAVGTTPDHTNDHITIDNAGKYLVTCSIVAESGAGATFEVGFGVYKNNGATLFENLHVHRQLTGGGGDTGSLSMSGIITCAATDTLEVWVWNETNTANVIIDDITLSVVRIGD